MLWTKCGNVQWDCGNVRKPNFLELYDCQASQHNYLLEMPQPLVLAFCFTEKLLLLIQMTETVDHMKASSVL
jgi:hypothetical protein